VEADPTLRGVERNALLICTAMTVVACFVPPRPAVALGVIGGGLLVGFSYWSLKSGVSVLVDAITARGNDGTGHRPRMARELAKLVLRYALLALLAYVMIARLRLHPWGLLAGASSVVAAVSLEAARLVFKKS
jgi:ATP synthase I chain